MWTERKKQIGPIAAREKAAAPASEKNRSAAPAGQKKWGVPLGQAPFGGAAGKEEHHVD